MKFQAINKKIEQIKSDYELIFIVNKNLKHRFVKDAGEFAFYDFKGEGVLNLPERRRIYVGIKDVREESVRQGIAKALAAISNLKIKSLKMNAYVEHCKKMAFQAVVEGFELAAYKFDKYKSERKPLSLTEIKISLDEYAEVKIPLNEAELGLEHGKIIAEATNFTRDVVNEIPEIYTPERMANDAIKLASELKNVKCEVFDEKYLKAEKMNAFLAVNQASPNPPRLIHLSYKPKKSIKRVVFVGKGLTYDSGGLSLKPNDYMVTMKSDKSGAAAALGIVKAASALELPFEIHAVLGATENMIDGKSYKPDDVIVSRSGVSIEVRNTDAEGRLVLADCLSWAQDTLKPDLLVDMATLTGACVVGLGEYTSGVMGENYALQSEFKELGERSGELLTVLEFNDHLRELIKSDIADVSNTASSRYGGALTAGLFLEKFIKDEYRDKWLHLDIAGPAYVQKPWGYNAAGATGAGVRANLYYLLRLARLHEKEQIKFEKETEAPSKTESKATKKAARKAVK